MDDFHSNFSSGLVIGDLPLAHKVIMGELGKDVVHNREDFCTILTNADVAVHPSMTDMELINAYVDNAKNKKVILGTSFLVNMRNKVYNVGSGYEVSDEGVKNAYKAISEYWGMYAPDSVYAMADGSALGDIAGAVLGKGMEFVNKKKFGALDAVTAQQKAKADLAQSVIAQRQAQIDAKAEESKAKAKNVKIAIIAGGSLLAVGLAVGVYLYIKKRKK